MHIQNVTTMLYVTYRSTEIIRQLSFPPPLCLIKWVFFIIFLPAEGAVTGVDADLISYSVLLKEGMMPRISMPCFLFIHPFFL